MTELAKRAVACKGWRWMPGMLWLLINEDGETEAEALVAALEAAP